MKIKLPPIGTVKKIKGLSNVFALNGFSSSLEELKNTSLYKYGKIEYFTGKTNELVFVSPVLWEDKYETRFLFTDYSSLNFHQGKIRCMCFTNEPYYGEEAGWKSYSWKQEEFESNDEKKGYKIVRNEDVVRLTFNLGELLSSLENSLKDKGVKIYIGETIYGLEVNEINNLNRKEQKFHNVFFPNTFDVGNYLSLMLIKRKAFSYENEIRIFIYYEKEEAGIVEKSQKKEYKKKERETMIERIPVSYKKIVSEVRISPFLNDAGYKEQKDKILKSFPEKIIVKSKLYASEKDVILDRV